MLKRRQVSTIFISIAAVLVALCMCFSLSGCSSNENAAPQLKEAQLNTPVIKTDGVLKVGVNTSQSPLAGMGNSKIIGIDVDIAAALADSLGLKLQIVDTGSNPAKALTNGEVDVALGVDSGDVPSGTTLSEKYIPTSVAIFALSSGNPTAPAANSGAKIAAQASSKSAWSVTNTFGNSSLVSSSDLEGAFKSLKDGTVQYVAADVVIGLYTANKAEMDVTIVATTENTTGYCAAVLSTNSELYTAISTGINQLVSNGTIAVIENKWLGQNVTLEGVAKVEKPAATSDSEESSEGEGEESTASAGSAS